MNTILLYVVLLSSSGSDASLDQRVLELSRQLRCLVCQNESLADSQADLAVDLRREIRGQMIHGKSDDEIKTFLTARYGDFVLYRPPFKPETYVLWFAPALLVCGGFFALMRIIRTQPHSHCRRGL